MITINQVAGLYGTAFMKAASIETAVNAFRKTGIFPLDEDIFPDWMYQPAESTDTDPPLEKGDSGPTSEPSESTSESTPGSSQLDRPKSSTSAFHVSPKDLKAVPLAERKEQKSDKRRGKTAVLTSSPNKEELKSSMKKDKSPKRKLQIWPHSNSSRPTEDRKVGQKKAKKVRKVREYIAHRQKRNEQIMTRLAFTVMNFSPILSLKKAG